MAKWETEHTGSPHWVIYSGDLMCPVTSTVTDRAMSNGLVLLLLGLYVRLVTYVKNLQRVTYIYVICVIFVNLQF